MIGVIKGTMRQKKEVTGLPLPIASYKANLKAPIRSLKVAITAKQSGSGTPSPDNIRPITGWSGANVTRTGKNFLRNRRTTATVAGIAYTVNADGSVFIEGGQTASATSIFSLVESTENYYNLPYLGLMYDTSYILNGCPAGGGSSSYRLLFRSGGAASNKTDVGSGVEFNIASDSSTLIWCPCIVIASGYTIPSDGLLFKPMIRLASELDDTFEAYTGNTYTIQLGDTYYGGSLDVTTGVLTVDRGIVDMGSLNWVYDSTYNRFNTTYSQIKASPAARTAKIMCSVLNPITDGRPVSQVPDNSIYQGTSYSISAHDHRFTDATLFTNDVTGQKIVYPLKTPFTVQLSPTQIEQLLGANNVFADCGDVEELIYTDRQVYYGR